MKIVEKQKQVQISEKTFCDMFMVCHIVLNDEIRACLEKDKLDIVERLEVALNDKLDKMVLHNIYSKSKDTNLTDTEREQARQEYLNRKGIHRDFRW